ncbi:MAG: SGNH/GDSL hydrolase family protein [Lentisphaeria bacterium]|nr:SGNH/GDSL hydrolase family protein [Lentisphaeria bacterium]
MKKLSVFMLAMAAAAIFAGDIAVNGFITGRWKTRVKNAFEITAQKTVKINAPKGQASFEGKQYPLDNGKDINKCYEGISFEVKGDGSNEWGTIGVNECNKTAGHFYFPLKNTDWKEYRVAFADMAPASDHTLGLPAQMPVMKICYFTLGDRWKITWTNAKRPGFSYEIRNVKLIEKIPATFKRGVVKARPLADVVKEMKAGKETLITCFGDSITAGTALRKGNKRYAVLLGEQLAKKFGNKNIKTECVAVGGAHTYDSIAWLDRDLSKGKPAVATMLIGYNNRSSAQTAELYRAQLEMWIERLLAKTEGKTAIILIPSVQGVPRWFAQDDMAAVTYEVAKKYNCTVCPLDKVVGKIGPVDYRAKFLADGIHPNQAGHQIFADELVKCFK